MDKIDSNKVLSHIDEAKNWLNEAKEEYTQSNRVRGELNLNLAQAEVKYAWELSRRQNVTQIVPTGSSRWSGKYFLPAAAACLIILGFTGGLYWLMRNDKAEAPALMVKNENISVASARPQPALSVAETTKKPATDEFGDDLGANSNRAEPKKLAKVCASPTERVKSGRKIVKTEVVKKISTRVTAVNQPQKVAVKAVNQPQKVAVKAVNQPQKVAVKVVNQPQKVAVTTVGSSKRTDVAERIAKAAATENQSVTKTTASESESGLIPNVPKLTVASLVIDEEALTKEASYSLKNGK
jgi:hypothetical protein